MTESDWLASTDVRAMLNFLEGKLSERKARLFAVACCRQISHLFVDDRSKTVIEHAERQADGLLPHDEWLATSTIRMDVSERINLSDAIYWTAEPDLDPVFSAQQASIAARSVDWLWLMELSDEERNEAWSMIDDLSSLQECREHRPQSELIRELVGNPFRFIPHLDARITSWCDGCIPKMAHSIYEEKDFSSVRMAVLADALEEAGGVGKEVLEHLRGPGPHVRGCWAVDAILARE